MLVQYGLFSCVIPSAHLVTEADDYTVNFEQDSTLRVILVNRVVVGRASHRQKNATSLTEPPFGYHSVRELVPFLWIVLRFPLLRLLEIQG